MSKPTTNKDAEEAGRRICYVENMEDAAMVLVLTPANGHKPWNPHAIWGQPGLFWGPPGIGKSNRVEKVGTGLGVRTEVIYPATQQPEAVAGALVPDGRGGAHIVSMLPGVRRLIEDRAGILFIDELSCARPAVQAAFLGLPIERRIGEDKLPGDIRVLSAANPPDEAAGGWDLEPPMANRFVHLYMRCPPVKGWCQWLMEEADPIIQNIEDGTAAIKAAWQNEYSRAKGYVVGFHEKTGYLEEKLLNMPKEGDPNRGRAWPSPRTWEMATRLFATCNILGKPGMISPMIHGCLGRGLALELETWLAEADLPSFDDIINLKWKPNPKRIDKTVAAYTSATSHILQEQDAKKKAEFACAYWEALKVGIDSGAADIVNKSAVSLVAAGLGLRGGPTLARASTPVMTELAKMGMGDYV